jgi:hypothetical protein
MNGGELSGWHDLLSGWNALRYGEWPGVHAGRRLLFRQLLQSRLRQAGGSLRQYPLSTENEGVRRRHLLQPPARLRLQLLRFVDQPVL